MEDLRIDNHKLMYHIERVYDWLKKKDIYPIYVEISPSGTCNHRCIFCAFEYLSYKPQFIEKEPLKKALFDMAKCGVRSVMFSGEGEPFLHKDIVEFILYAKECGLDVAVAMNGSFFTKEKAKASLSILTWIKISINGGTKEGYARVHRCKEEDFDKVINNIKEAIRIRNENRYKTTIGAQIVLLPENIDEVCLLAKILEDIGADYLVVKPFIKHLMSNNNISREITHKELNALDEKIKGFKIPIYFRKHSFIKLKTKRPYKRCLALPFFCEITSNGNIYTCGPYLGNPNFCYGNIYEKLFEEIWKGETRGEILDKVSKLDIGQCMKNCRLDEVNRYLWDLKNPPSHVNFI